MKLPETLSGWLGVVGVACTLVGGAYGLISSVATKDYHEKDLKPIQQSLENIEQSAVVERIRGLLRSRCGSNFGPDLQKILDAQLLRYHELTGREFRTGECRDGVWYTAGGIRG